MAYDAEKQEFARKACSEFCVGTTVILVSRNDLTRVLCRSHTWTWLDSSTRRLAEGGPCGLRSALPGQKPSGSLDQPNLLRLHRLSLEVLSLLDGRPPWKSLRLRPWIRALKDRLGFQERRAVWRSNEHSVAGSDFERQR